VHIALVTAREALSLDEDLPPLIAALRAIGAEVSTPCWDDPAEDWARYEAAVLRSTWDYVERIAEFREWGARCARDTRLLNPPEVVRWNTDKHYLQELAARGVAVVPTLFLDPGAEAGEAMDRFLAGGEGALSVGRGDGFGEFVVKPAIGAGSKDTARYRREDRARAQEHASQLLAAGRSVMLQPYLDQVDHHGETALIYLGGAYSHAIRKGPLLQLDAGLVQGLFAPEQIAPREPTPAERQLAELAYQAIPFADLAYARIDLIRDGRGEPVLLELELTEPSLFFSHAPGAASRFAQALVERLRTDPAG
jgi:O-ureido-D-serine cyclo-ligase